MSILKPITENEYNAILKIQVNSETIDNAYEQYSSAILDVFDHQLSMEEANQLLGYFVEHNLKYENRFIRFMEEVYTLNKSMPVLIEVYLKQLESTDILRILHILDYKDKLLFIDLIRNHQGESHLFLIEDEEALSLFIKLSTRELLFATFHFTNIPMTVLGNFDLSFPIFFNCKDDIEKYINIARNNQLFLRNINVKA
jgi:hypothetical protein